MTHINLPRGIFSFTLFRLLPVAPNKDIFLLVPFLSYEVTYVMDRTAYSAADVGFRTWVRRGGELGSHSPGSRTRGPRCQPPSGTSHIGLSE